MFSEEKLSQAGKKTIKHWYEIFFSSKMLIKIKTRAGKTSAYQMLLSFKTWKLIIFFLNIMPEAVSVVMQLPPDITRSLPDIFRCPVLIFRPAS